MNRLFKPGFTLTDEQIFDFVQGHLLPDEMIFVEMHLLDSSEDQERVDDYREWHELCEALRDQITNRGGGLNVVYHDFKAEKVVDPASSKTKLKERLAADSSLRSNSPKPFCDIREQHMKEVEICGVRLRVTLTRFENDRIWLEIEALETDPAYRVFTFGIGPYTGQANLQGDHPPFFITEMPSSLFSSFGHVQIKLQPTDE